MEFPRQEYWSGLPFPSTEDLPNPRTELTFPALAGGFFTTKPPGEPSLCIRQPLSRMVNDSVHVKLWNSLKLLGEANLLLMEKSWDQAHISIMRHRAVSG